MRTLFAVCLIVLSLPESTSGAVGELFSIAKPIFSARVLDDYTIIQPATNNLISRAVLSNGRIYFSFTVLGEDRAIQYLQNRQRLDVNVVVFADGFRKDTYSIGIDPSRWAQLRAKLLQEYDQDGFFTWRTYMYTEQTDYSSIELIVRDGNNNVIADQTISFQP